MVPLTIPLLYDLYRLYHREADACDREARQGPAWAAPWKFAEARHLRRMADSIRRRALYQLGRKTR